MDADTCLSTSPPGLPRGRHYDAVVVGGGVMGTCAAFQLASRGNTVLLLEQFEFLHPHWSTSRGPPSAADVVEIDRARKQ